MAGEAKQAPVTVADRSAGLVLPASAEGRNGLHQVLDGLPLAITFMRRDEKGRWLIIAQNQKFEEWAEADCAAHFTDIERIDLLSGADIANRLAAMAELPAAAEDFRWTVGNAVVFRHYAGRLVKLSSDVAQLSVSDCTAEVNAENNLRREKTLDPLTGLANRIAFSEVIEDRLAELAGAADRGSQIAVLVLDLDRFSQINENLGHLAGDELLATVARRLLSAIRASDILARIAGDVFGVLVNLKHGPDEVLQVARRMQEALASPFQLSGREIHVSVTIGVATPIDGEEHSASLIGNAEFALQRAKRLGHRIEAFHPADAHLARRRFSLQAELRQAIEHGRLHMVYQPLIDLKTGRVSGLEALARWTHPDLGVVSPTEFIPLAEETGMILTLGRWALDTGCQQLAAWQEKVPEAADVSLSVNVSSHQLAHDDLVSAVGHALANSGLPGKFLKLELTESAIVENAERATKVLQALKRLDVRIAMDDFGTGFSSLASLQRLPIDVLKVDRSFVNDMLDNEDSFEIVNVILSLARTLQMETVAEGIETKEQASRLRSLGCNFGQGYLFARPLAVEDVPARLSAIFR